MLVGNDDVALINPPSNSPWHASLSLRFTHRENKTVLSERRHDGPLIVQRPFYPEPVIDICHIYVVHPPGGYVGGDQLSIKVDLTPNSVALMTTPAAGKCYRCPQQAVAVEQQFTLATSTRLEWLPQETIIYDGGQLSNNTRIDLAAEATFLGWDIVCLGRRQSGESFSKGYWRSHISLYREQRLIFNERSQFEGGSIALTSMWGLAGYSVSGTFVCSIHQPFIVTEIRRVITHLMDEYFSVTQLPEVIVCRYLGHHAERAKELFSNAWQIIRLALTGKRAIAPRIWAT